MNGCWRQRIPSLRQSAVNRPVIFMQWSRFCIAIAQAGQESVPPPTSNKRQKQWVKNQGCILHSNVSCQLQLNCWALISTLETWKPSSLSVATACGWSLALNKLRFMNPVQFVPSSASCWCGLVVHCAVSLDFPPGTSMSWRGRIGRILSRSSPCENQRPDLRFFNADMGRREDLQAKGTCRQRWGAGGRFSLSSFALSGS